MGIYRLSDDFELKGWRDLPYALVDTRKHIVKKLTPIECFFLLTCDGASEIEDIPATGRLLKQGVIEQLDSPGKSGESPAFVSCNQLYRSKVQLAITGRCNLHCRHCLAADGDTNVSTQLTVEECDRIFNEMIENDIFELWITGGEPLVHPDFRTIFQSAVEHGLHITSIFTNAWLVSPDLLDFIKASGQNPKFVVSFDGMSTHDWMRNQKGAEERTLEKIALLRQHDFSVRIGLNVNSVTAPRVIETCRVLVHDYHVNSLRPIYTSPTPRWFAALENDIEPLPLGQYYDLMIELVRISRVENWDAEIDLIHMPKLHQHPKSQKVWNLLSAPPEPDGNRPIMSSCGRASDVMFIGSDGRALPCSAYEGETAELGLFRGSDVNVLETPLKDILTCSEYAREFEVAIDSLKESDPACSGCKWLSICCGGCPLYTLGRKHVDATNPILAHEVNPICVMYKGGYATKYLSMLEETEGSTCSGDAVSAGRQGQ